MGEVCKNLTCYNLGGFKRHSLEPVEDADTSSRWAPLDVPRPGDHGVRGHKFLRARAASIFGADYRLFLGVRAAAKSAVRGRKFTTNDEEPHTLSALLAKAKESLPPFLPSLPSIASGKLLAWEWRKILIREAAHVTDTWCVRGRNLYERSSLCRRKFGGASLKKGRKKGGDGKWTGLHYLSNARAPRTYSRGYLIYQRSIDVWWLERLLYSSPPRTTPTMCVAVSMSDISKGLD